jgi:Tfp pilus assembly protein PilF
MFSKHLYFFINILFYFFVSCKSNTDQKNNAYIEPSKKNNTATEAHSNYSDSLETILRQDSFNIVLRAKLATDYYSNGELGRAAYHFLIIYEMDNKNMLALTSLGNIYYDTQEDDKAIQFYEKAMVLEPDNIDMRCDLATCYFRINKLKKAEVILRDNIKKDFTHKKSHYNLAIILKQAGKINEANSELNIYNSLDTGMK